MPPNGYPHMVLNYDAIIETWGPDLAPLSGRKLIPALREAGLPRSPIRRN